MSDILNEEKSREVESYLRQIGVSNLADDIENLRRGLQAFQVFHAHQDFITRAIREEINTDEILKNMILVNAQTFDKAAAYNNVVITAGYAGFFTIWNFIRDKMNAFDMKVVAALLGASLLIFVAWTLLNSITNSRQMRQFSVAIRENHVSADERLHAINEASSAISEAALRLHYVWHFFFIGAVSTGFLAGIILLTLLGLDIFGFEVSIEGLWIWLKNEVFL